MVSDLEVLQNLGGAVDEAANDDGNGWPDFELTGATANKQQPAKAIRDSLEVVWSSRTDPDDSTLLQYQGALTVVFHCVVNTLSTTAQTYLDYISQQFINTPTLFVGGRAGVGAQAKPLTGNDWQIERTTCVDHGNGCSTVTTVAHDTVLLGWYTATGEEV